MKSLSTCTEYEFRSFAFEEKEKLVYLARRKIFRNKKKTRSTEKRRAESNLGSFAGTRAPEWFHLFVILAPHQQMRRRRRQYNNGSI